MRKLLFFDLASRITWALRDILDVLRVACRLQRFVEYISNSAHIEATFDTRQLKATVWIGINYTSKTTTAKVVSQVGNTSFELRMRVGELTQPHLMDTSLCQSIVQLDLLQID